MPIIKSAIKRAKQTIKRRERNVGIKQDIKSAIKAFMAKPTATTLSAAQSEIDTAVKKKLIKKNTAARRKSSLAKAAKNAGVKLATAKKAPVKQVTAAKAPAVKVSTPKAKAAPATKTAVKKPIAAKKPAAKKVTK
jgi:ribosomal protein S20